ncbi:MAG: hypothetical protein ACREQ9_21700 [Candidatus Binatia bacterium]
MAAAAALALSACYGPSAGDEASARLERERRNLLRNGDFELGREPWFDLAGPSRPYWHGFEIADDVACRGRRSARLPLEAREDGQAIAIHGFIQEVAPAETRDTKSGEASRELPAILSGCYRVERWQRRLPKQYVQFVVIVWGSDTHPRAPNIQMRYVLAGIREPPFPIANARFVFLGGEEPETGKWIRFERNLRKDWLEHWGALPRRYEKLRLLFEARFDGRQEPLTGALGEAYFDDLYLGPSLGEGR